MNSIQKISRMNCFLPAQNLKILVKSIQAMARLPGEDLYFEATNEGLSLRAVNSSRSGYMCFLFKPQFFMHWSPATVRDNETDEDRREGDDDRTTGNYCKISMKSALIVYKALLALEKSIESCSISIDVDDWRLVFELQCKSGVIRKYRLVLLNCTSMHALFDKSLVPNLISIPGKLFVDGVHQNFHSGQDEVTMTVDMSELNLRNYVDDAPQPEKVLKTQLHLDRSEFEQYLVQANADVTFCLKELRALLIFVETYQLPVVIRFDKAGKPIIFSVESDPAFVGDLVLATFIEAEDTQQLQQPQVGSGQQQPVASLRQQSQASQPIVNVESDSGSVPVRDKQGRLMPLGPRRVSVYAAAIGSTASRSVMSSSKNRQSDASRMSAPRNGVEEQTTTTASNGGSSRDTADAAAESMEHEENSRQGDGEAQSHQQSGSGNGRHRQNDSQSAEDFSATESGERVNESEDPTELPTTPPSKRVRPNLFANWSQSTTITESQLSEHQDDTHIDRLILAPDSDMEDY